MERRSLNVRSYLDFSPSSSVELAHYLQGKIKRFAIQLLALLPFSDSNLFVQECLLSKTDSTASFCATLTDSTSCFCMTLDLLEENGTSAQKLTGSVNQLLWEFTEWLEVTAGEFFAQIQYSSIQTWDSSLHEIVRATGILFLQVVRTLLICSQQLGVSLSRYGNFKRWNFFSTVRIDPKLFKALQRTERFLEERYQIFQEHYHAYKSMSLELAEAFVKQEEFSGFKSLSPVDRAFYTQVWYLIKFIEKSSRSVKELLPALKRCLQNYGKSTYLMRYQQNESLEMREDGDLFLSNPVIRLFRVYLNGMEEQLFKCSLDFKQVESALQNAYGELCLEKKDLLGSGVVELNALIEIMGRYRAFLLTNRPDPYQRSRWGFTEWIVSPEPPSAKELIALIDRGEELKKCFEHLSQSIREDKKIKLKREAHALHLMKESVHEMGNPFLNYAAAKNIGADFVREFAVWDELGAASLSCVEETEILLSQMMREDWKYHVLGGMPLFHYLYRIHNELQNRLLETREDAYLKRFCALLGEVREKSRLEDSPRIEAERPLQEIRKSLEAFLERVCKNFNESLEISAKEVLIKKYRRELLQHRYQFSRMVNRLVKEEAVARENLLFVDQYFESIDNLIDSLDRRGAYSSD